MPKVNGKEYPYTREGVAAAQAAQGPGQSIDWEGIPEGGGKHPSIPPPMITVPIGPKDNQRFVNIELLVEGQRNTKGILRGDKPTAEQVDIAMEVAMERFEAGEQLPEFDTYEAAREAATKERPGAYGQYTPEPHWTGYSEAADKSTGSMVRGERDPQTKVRYPTESQRMRGGSPEGIRKILAEEMPHMFTDQGRSRREGVSASPVLDFLTKGDKPRTRIRPHITAEDKW
jgi:hypothetical protein